MDIQYQEFIILTPYSNIMNSCHYFGRLTKDIYKTTGPAKSTIWEHEHCQLSSVVTYIATYHLRSRNFWRRKTWANRSIQSLARKTWMVWNKTLSVVICALIKQVAVS